MKYLFVFAFLIIMGTLVYGPKIAGGGLPSEEELKEYIESVKKMKNMSSDSEIDEEIFSELQNGNIALPYEYDIEEIAQDDEGCLEPAYEIHAPIMQKLIEMFPAQDEEFDINTALNNMYLMYLSFVKQHNHYSGNYFILSLLVIVLGYLLNKLGCYSSFSMISRLGFFISRYLIIGLSISAIIFWLIVKRNFWLDAGVNSYVGPVALLLSSSFILKVYDPNFPVFNRLFGCAIMPIVASILMIGGNCV
jgi:hypothetical protein